MRPRVVTLIGLMTCIGLSGCLVHSRDVTQSKDYRTDYRRSKVYVLNQDACLYERPAMDWLGEALVNRTRLRVEPRDRQPPVNDKFIGALPTGTRFRFERLVYANYFEYSEVMPIARVLNGRYAGKVVDLSRISNPPPHLHAFRPFRNFVIDPKWLRPASTGR